MSFSDALYHRMCLYICHVLQWLKRPTKTTAIQNRFSNDFCSYQVGQLADQLGVSPWVLTTLPVLLGTVVLLRLLDAQASSPGWISGVDIGQEHQNMQWFDLDPGIGFAPYLLCIEILSSGHPVRGSCQGIVL